MGRILTAAALLCAFLGLSCTVHASNGTKLDVRLLSKSAVKTSNGCAFALWQRDRDPAKDKYAYVLYVGFYHAHPLPALVKIGKKVIELEKVDPGFADSTTTDKLQLFRDSASGLSVLLELTKFEVLKNSTKVEEARLTFIKRGKHPFVMTVKGGFQCADDGESDAAKAEDAEVADAAIPGNLDPNGIKLEPGKSFNSLREIPAHIAALATELGEACDAGNTPGAGMRFAISDAMTLWQLPCALYASNASNVFATALNGTPHAVLLEVPGLTGESDPEPSYDILNAEVMAASGLIRSLNINAAGNCGSLDYYQLIESDGESVELKLLERRERTKCSGAPMAPEKFPIVYRAKQ